MKTTWRTLWQQRDIVVYRDEVEVDRVAADDIVRVCLVYRGRGDYPGEVTQSVVELSGDAGFVLFESNTGFAGRVNFERQSFWVERACVHWVSAAHALLPWRLRFGAWRGDGSSHAFRRLSRDELAGHVDRWPLEGPETWEERKARRIERSRLFGHAGASPA
ncbi:MAG: hypothetical protein ABI281_14285 [Caldimonas sp.]